MFINQGQVTGECKGTEGLKKNYGANEAKRKVMWSKIPRYCVFQCRQFVLADVKSAKQNTSREMGKEMGQGFPSPSEAPACRPAEWEHLTAAVLSPFREQAPQQEGS